MTNDLERKLDLVKYYKEYYITEKLSAGEVASRYYVDVVELKVEINSFAESGNFVLMTLIRGA